MTKVKVNPGVCGFVTSITAESEDGEEAVVKVASGCESIRKMMEDLGNTFDPIEVCLTRQGTGVFYDYAGEHFPVHAACPVINGILKCIEAECSLALPADASISFVSED